MAEVFLVAARRTPFGAFGGKLKNLTATELAVHAAKATLSSAGVDPAAVEEAIFGNVAQTAPDAAYLARHVALKSGMRHDSTAFAVNRLCGSGFQAAISGAHAILGGEADLILAGGTESMSQAPLSVFGQNIRFGTKLGSAPPFTDTLWQALTDSHVGMGMGNTAEKLAAQYGISRADSNAYALRSQKNYATALAAGLYAAELATVPLEGGKKGPESMTADEHPRPETTLEALAKLPAVFQKGGTVTAGTASGISDGAGAMLLASPAGLKTHGLTPLARVCAWAVAGVDPSIMGLGPAPAIRKLMGHGLEHKPTKGHKGLPGWPKGLQLADIKHVELNEAFAPQVLAVISELTKDGLNKDAVNPHGGAITVGHPLGASGARIMGHLAHSLAASGQKYGIGAACIGGGQGIAVLLENVHAKHSA